VELVTDICLFTQDPVAVIDRQGAAMRIRVRRRLRDAVRAWDKAALLAITGFILAGCQDQPTSPVATDGAAEPIIDFELTPEGARAAEGADLVGMHKLATIPLRMESVRMLSAEVGTADNSPFDLTYFGGPVITGATSYNIYVNCVPPDEPATCWGTGTLAPGTFLRDLNRSDFIRLVNEYTGVDARGKFQVRDMRTRASFTNPSRATLQEIFQILSDAVTRTGASGYGAIYHVFLPRGTNMCIEPANCYSPNNPANWVFCAFHGSVNFGPTRHVLFTLEPYQGVDGCRLPGQTPNGLIDATASTLSHELFETITDPDLNGWSNALFGFEMSDMCFAFGSNQLLNGHNYFLQSEYSNTLHLCTDHRPGV
jgi:hypothetical protein